jgi:hypothetical protein
MTDRRVSILHPNQTALAVEVDAVLNGLAYARTLVHIRGEHIVNVAATRAAATRVIATVVRLRSGYGYSAKSASRHT